MSIDANERCRLCLPPALCGAEGNSGGLAVAPLRGNTGVSLESQQWADVGC